MCVKIGRHLILTLWFLIVSSIGPGVFAAPIKTRVLYFSSFPEIMQSIDKPGLAELATAIAEETAKNPNTFFIHGGASLGPSVFGAMDNGAHMIDILNALNPSVMAIGKREFSYGYDNFVLNAISASFPMVTSNLTDARADGPIDATYPSYLLQSGGTAIGVIALTSANAITEYGATQAKLLEPDKATKDTAAGLRDEGADAVILLADTDFDDLSALRADGTVDVIFYTHNFDNPQSLDHQGKLLTEGALDGKIIAVDFWIEKNGGNTPTLVTTAQMLPLASYDKDPFVASIIDSYRVRLEQLLGPGIAPVTKAFDTFRSNIRSRENAFANLIADALREQVSADIALLNGGTIRGNVRYDVGHKISRGDIQRELPFGGRSALVRMLGSDIQKTLEHGLDCGLRTDGCFTQVSNLQVTFDSGKPKGERIVELLVGGQPLEADRYYNVAISNFMAMGNDGYEYLGKAEKLFGGGTNRVIWNIVVEYIERAGAVSPELEGRIRDIAGRNRLDTNEPPNE